MQIFEFHFNPKQKEDLVFDSFCYEPENVYEKRLGSLFLIGEIKNAILQNLKFLDNFASFFKKEYYSAPIKLSPEASLKEGLKKANEFLEGVAKSGDVSWLGNLNLAILSLKNFELNFAKVGMIKILLLRQGQIIDIGKNLEFSEIEPYPLKIFGNIVSGKLTENDIILVLTQDIFNFFSEQNLLSEFSELSKQDDGAGVNEKKLKKILKAREKELLKNSGVCFLCLLTREVWIEEKKPRAFTFQKPREKFSIKKVFLPIINSVRNFIFSRLKSLPSFFLKGLSKLKEIPKKILKLSYISRCCEKYTILRKLKPEIRIPKIKIPKPEIKFTPNLKRGLISLSLLILLLISGFFIFKREEKIKLEKYQFTLSTIREDFSRAENLLILKNEKGAFDILKKARQDLLPLIKERSHLQKEAISLKNSVEEKMEQISKLEKIPVPELFFEFGPREFIPQKMIYWKENLYFYNPYADNVYKLTPKAEKFVLSTNQGFDEAIVLDNELLFFKKPNLFFFLKNDQFQESIEIKLPYSDFTPKALAVFRSSLYFLDGKNGEIIKYPKFNKDSSQTWLKKDEFKKPFSGKSMAIDGINGTIWILNKDNTIFRYFRGNLKDTLVLNLFPEPKNLSKISLQLGLFYLLEPTQSRLIVLTKTAEVFKQFQSEKFDNLKDFAVSEDNKTIWLLNGQKVYQIEI